MRNLKKKLRKLSRRLNWKAICIVVTVVLSGFIVGCIFKIVSLHGEIEANNRLLKQRELIEHIYEKPLF